MTNQPTKQYAAIAQANVKGLPHTNEATTPDEKLDKNICMKAWPDAAVPRILGCLSSAAIDNTGIASAMPTLNIAIGNISQTVLDK